MYRDLLTIFVICSVISSSCGAKVVEVGDKFIQATRDGMWLAKFYAPWCAHCKRLDPIWSHVSQGLYNTPIRVVNVDCTKFTKVASHFKIRAYPTILFINGNFIHEYTGDRTKDEMIAYGMRMSQPFIQHVTYGDTIETLKETYPVFFGFVGKQAGHLWDVYTYHARKYQPKCWFFAMSHDIVSFDNNPPSEAIFVYKDEEAYFFDSTPNLHDIEMLNTTLDKWINAERFGTFPRITRFNINHLMDTEKYIGIVVVSENKLDEITQTEKDFKDMVEGIIRKRKRDLHGRFQFGWVGSTDLANSIAMSELSVPHLIVLNSTTNHHHMPDDDPVLMTPEAVSLFLDQIHNQMARTYGGNGWFTRLYRALFEARITLANMWHGNPVLTTLVFGLPLGFLSLICYSVCCADILDADEEEPTESHEKKD